MELLFEIGTEELPALAVNRAIGQLRDEAAVLLERERLSFDEIKTYGGPRRLSLYVRGIPGEALPLRKKKKGPPLSLSRKEDGSFSEAAVGFARSQGLDPQDLVIEDDEKGSYLFAVTEVGGEKTKTLLPGMLLELASSIKFERSMRWGAGERFARPVRWVLALLDEDVLDLEFAGVKSQGYSRGHRFLCGEPFVKVEKPFLYEDTLERAFVVVDHEKRREKIIKEAKRICALESEDLTPVLDEDVVGEVVQLVEWPNVTLGFYDERFLGLPREVLEHAIEEHQRFFPVVDGQGRARPCFVAVHNGDKAFETLIRKGYERVLRARLSDAEFFFREDIKRPLIDRKAELARLVYQAELGSMAEKSERLEKLVESLGTEIGCDSDTVERARRAAILSKCDLVTHMVVEFTSLQGIVGSIYARLSGEDERVANAIQEQYFPRKADDSIPSTMEGALLSIAEKVDNLVASFGLGYVPSGSEDPYGLRRQANGLIQIALGLSISIPLAALIETSAGLFESEAHGFVWSREAKLRLEDFIKARERIFFTEKGFRYDLIDSVLGLDWKDPFVASKKLIALSDARESGLLARLYTGFERCHNLSKGMDSDTVDSQLLKEEAERVLYDISKELEPVLAVAVDSNDWSSSLSSLEKLCDPIDRLFDEVLIMSEDEEIRKNRLALLVRVKSLFSKIADYTLLKWD
ncbi:MAG: glycine--tRNA ligase subunit beta [Actinomycetota bacterium]|nr:glycine--tRNA ligase subunit beta [Actinomycetota bacterium]